MLFEYALAPKSRGNTGPYYNEDLCGHIGNTFWLLDGASSPARLLVSGAVPDAKWLVHHLDATLRVVLIQNPELELRETLSACEDILHEAVEQACTGTPATLPQLVPHTTVVLLRVHADTAEYLLLQDSTLLAFDGQRISVFEDGRQDALNAAFYGEQDACLREGGTFAGEGVQRQPGPDGQQ